MAMTKYNLIRLKHLLAMLKENRYPNYTRFLAEMRRQDPAGTYRLSARTLLRDIEYLKSQYGAPIQYDGSRRGYYLTVPEWNIDIPVLEDSEMRAAVLGARLAENLMPSPVKQEIRSAVDTLLAANEKGLAENTALLSLVALGSRVSISPEIFRVLFNAWQEHVCVQIVYSSVSGAKSGFVIEPHALAFFEGNWYVKAVARSKNGKAASQRELTLAVHRICSAEEQKERFSPDQKIIDEVNRREIFKFPKIHDVRLKVSGEALKYLQEQFDFEVERTEGEARFVRIDAVPEYRIVNFVLVEGGEVRLLNHPELREKIIARAESVIAAQKA